ncbi:toxin-antitoxin system YwqK family antitoxin [uncultured Hymenobacter sp.]|uniref:toxin-antitoxin system YwqK family antitoxin n=1 Tax=uncultured Hymenobacter sp. TaxID=170016 RepID=UPI0035CAB32E
MRLVPYVIALVALLSSCSTAKQGPIGFWSRQRYDQQLRQHGPWPTYYDDAKRQPMALGRFRHGRYVGRWRYYAPTGELERTERFARNSYNLISITEYQAGSKKKRQGQARILDEPDGVHFFWFGEWKVFDVEGRQTAVEHYDRGQLRGTQLIPSELRNQ